MSKPTTNLADARFACATAYDHLVVANLSTGTGDQEAYLKSAIAALESVAGHLGYRLVKVEPERKLRIVK